PASAIGARRRGSDRAPPRRGSRCRQCQRHRTSRPLPSEALIPHSSSVKDGTSSRRGDELLPLGIAASPLAQRHPGPPLVGDKTERTPACPAATPTTKRPANRLRARLPGSVPRSEASLPPSPRRYAFPRRPSDSSPKRLLPPHRTVESRQTPCRYPD